MDILFITLVIVAVFIIVAGLVFKQRKRSVPIPPMPGNYRMILQKEVVFYAALDSSKKNEFENRMMHFLASTRITGVNTEVEDSDKVYIAASAIIPIFGFPGWEYPNLHEVLLYPDSFNHDFQQKGNDRSILGMVGDGAYNRVMILSRHELQQAFINRSSKTNTAIHEFVHLVDKTDGSIDGVPAFFVDQQYVLPWLALMRTEMQKILANRSDINPYGATNEAEFLAVAAEYFFERPELLESKHPALYQLLATLFRQQPNAAPAATVPGH